MKIPVRILLIVDKKRWAYDTIARTIKEYNDDSSLEFDVLSIKENIKKIHETRKKYDFYFVFGWQNYDKVSFLEKKRTLLGVHSHQSFDNGKTTPEKDIYPSQKIIDFLATFRAINVVSRRLCNIFSKCGLDITYTKNGVDEKLFSFYARDWKRFCVGCSASKKNDYNKGFFSIVKPACDKLLLPCNSSMIDINRRKNKDMPKFYKEIDCYVCASNSEDMSLSILEAASTGCIIVTTKTGDSVELIQDGINGFFIDRSINSISEILLNIRKNVSLCGITSKNIRNTIENNWTWNKNSKEWLGFIESSINL